MTECVFCLNVDDGHGDEQLVRIPCDCTGTATPYVHARCLRKAPPKTRAQCAFCKKRIPKSWVRNTLHLKNGKFRKFIQGLGVYARYGLNDRIPLPEMDQFADEFEDAFESRLAEWQQKQREFIGPLMPPPFLRLTIYDDDEDEFFESIEQEEHAQRRFEQPFDLNWFVHLFTSVCMLLMGLYHLYIVHTMYNYDDSVLNEFASKN